MSARGKNCTAQKNKQNYFNQYNNKMKATKNEYEQYLNGFGKILHPTNFIIGGKMRAMEYGSALRKHDPIAFYVGYNEWRRQQCMNYGTTRKQQ